MQESLSDRTVAFPWGGNASPLIADLCLSMMEYKYIMANPKNGRILTNTMRYLDDVLTLNTRMMLECYKEIYDSSLPLNFDDIIDGCGHYLDLSLDRTQGTITLYDKRTDFGFHVIRFTNATSNCPRKIGNNTFYSQVIRMTNVHTSQKTFLMSIEDLIYGMKLIGYGYWELNSTFEKACKQYSGNLRKYKLHTMKKANAFFHKSWTKILNLSNITAT